MDLTKFTEMLSKVKNLSKEIENIKNTLLEMQKIYSEVQLFLDLLKNI